VANRNLQIIINLKKPLWGTEDEADPKVFQKKIGAAAASGIGHFIFDWYWYEDAPFLNRALEQGYLGAANKNEVKFCLMWANHDWHNIMPARLHEKESPLVFRGSYDAAAFDKIIDYILTRYFTQSSYLMIDGCPYFSIYELKNLIAHRQDGRSGSCEDGIPALSRESLRKRFS